MRIQESHSSANPVAHPALGALLRYWQRKRGAGALPSRRDIDPLEMGAELLPHLVLADLFDRGTHVRFRLVGTSVVKRLGFDPTARYLGGEMSGGWFDYLALLNRLVYCERAPVEAESELSWEPGRRLGIQHLLLPLAQDGPDPSIALAAIVFQGLDPFPPTLRALGASAVHREVRRQVLKTLSHMPSAPAGREVA